MIFNWKRLAVVVFALIALSGCSDSTVGPIGGFDFRAEEPFSFEIPIEARTALQVLNINGEVAIAGVTDGDAVVVTGNKIVEANSQSEAADHLEDIEIVQTLTESAIELRSDHPSGSQPRNYEVDYSILVPADWDIQVTEANGRIELDSLAGAIDVILANGSVVLLDLFANLRVVVANGDIGGNFVLPAAGQCRLSVANGEIDIAIPEETSAEFSARIVNGTIMVTDLALQDAVNTNYEVSGTLGAGDGLIDLEVTNGAIVVDGE